MTRSGSVPAPCRGTSRSGARAPRRARGRTRRGRAPRRDPRVADRPCRCPRRHRVPELLERERVPVGDLRRLEGDDDVLLTRPRVVRPVRRAAPHRCAVADDELVVHEVGDARDAASRDGERLDRGGRRLGRRRHRDRAGVGEVVQQPHLDAALYGAEQRGEDECPRVGLEADVVERDVERRRACERKPAMPRATSAGRWPPSVSVSIAMAIGRPGAAGPSSTGRKGL